ncbi:MFS transporter [Nocardia sp. CA-107356]|uniref:MFS transporter n=1 Tax=Nocardia sp. CA-107356 TaxID=3239972 RepID=UPI003D922FC9
MLFKGIGDLIPLYALYAVLFADHGLNTGQISSLLAIWSATAFLLEVPSGAWADTVSRRGLLVLSGVLLTAGFTSWTVLPTYLGFAVGFFLWGTSGALVSGTFEALLYDELVARGERQAYPRIIGYARAASEAAIVIAILAATPLFIWGGYPLLGWSSVAIAAVHTLIGLTLPSAPKAVSAADVEDLEEDAGYGGAVSETVSRSFATYLSMLRTGVGEAIRVRAVRNGLALGALLFGITAFDEYFALLGEEVGVATAVVPLLVGVTVIGSLVGSMLAGRTEGISARTMAIAVGLGGVLFVGGAVVAGLAVRWPGSVYVFVGVGFTAIGASYGIVYNAGVVAGARLQDAIEGRARATVTSVSGLAAEVVALAVFGFAAIATMWLSMSTTLALLGATILPIALATPAWLPRRVARSSVERNADEVACGEQELVGGAVDEGVAADREGARQPAVGGFPQAAE